MAAADRGPTARPKLARGRTDDAEQGSGRIHGKTCCCCGRRQDDGPRQAATAEGGATGTRTARTGGRLQQPDPRRALLLPHGRTVDGTERRTAGRRSQRAARTARQGAATVGEDEPQRVAGRSRGEAATGGGGGDGPRRTAASTSATGGRARGWRPATGARTDGQGDDRSATGGDEDGRENQIESRWCSICARG